MKKFIIMLVLVMFVVVACGPSVETLQAGIINANVTPQPTHVPRSNAPYADALSKASASTLYRYVDKDNGNVCYFVVPDYSSDSISLFCMKGDN